MSADAKRSVALAITGASGALYATRTLAALLERGCQVELIVTEYGRRLLRDELGDAAAVDRLADYLAGKYGEGVRNGTLHAPQQPRSRRHGSPAAARIAKRWPSCPVR